MTRTILRHAVSRSTMQTGEKKNRYLHTSTHHVHVRIRAWRQQSLACSGRCCSLSVNFPAPLLLEKTILIFVISGGSISTMLCLSNKYIISWNCHKIRSPLKIGPPRPKLLILALATIANCMIPLSHPHSHLVCVVRSPFGVNLETSICQEILSSLENSHMSLAANS